MPGPSFIDGPAGWQSEVRGDDPPKRSGWYVVTVEQKTAGKYTLEKSDYDSKKGRWCGAGGEVLAYMELPKPYKRKGVCAIRLIHGDCLEVMKTLEAGSVDAVVTDPPAGIAFMGKAWDKDKGGRDNWIAWMEQVARECLRMIKPGGHALVWAIPRTSHWTAMAWENAGWEVRDRIAFAFGSGFPKALDVGKAIDAMNGAEREVVGQGRLSGKVRGIYGAMAGSKRLSQPSRTGGSFGNLLTARLLRMC